MAVWLVSLLALFLVGCAQSGTRPEAPEFRLSALAKTDVDSVAELHVRSAFQHLRVLAEKLYRRNPREWRKAGHASVEQAVFRLFPDGPAASLPEAQGRRGTDAVHLAFQEDFRGDRVAVFIWGLATMTLAAYGNQTEFYVLSDLDAQKLYNAARNYEIAAWKLANARDAEGRPYLLSNEIIGEQRNLSFEREFGKLIGETDMMARIVAGRTQRTIVRVIQNLATAAFLPI
jgi:hypothetical protein